jgi:hypothetical protein
MGCAIIYGVGVYRERVFNASGTLVWDQTVGEAGGSTTNSPVEVQWGGISAGQPNAQTITTIYGFTASAAYDGAVVSFVAGLTNKGATTIQLFNAAGVAIAAPVPVVKDSGGASIPLTGGEITTGNTTVLLYSNTTASFHVVNLLQPGASLSTQFQVFTASGTWTKPAGLFSSSRAHLECWGAGGGGSPAIGSLTSGGGGGAYSDRWIAISALGATETVTIPLGGAVGVAGGNATFGTELTAYGGGAPTSLSLNRGGGGGGGETSAGSNPTNTLGAAGGGPWNAPGGQNSGGTGSAGSPSLSGGGGGADALGTNGTAIGAGGAGYFGGGGGAGGCAGDPCTNPVGGASVWGGGGGGALNGGGHSPSAGGASLWGGHGGAGNVAGTAPGGGGGGLAAGGAGQCQITLFP